MQPGVDVFTEHSACPKGIKTAIVTGNGRCSCGHLTLIKAAIESYELALSSLWSLRLVRNRMTTPRKGATVITTMMNA